MNNIIFTAKKLKMTNFDKNYHRASRACEGTQEMRLVDGGWACEVNGAVWIVDLVVVVVVIV